MVSIRPLKNRTKQVNPVNSVERVLFWTVPEPFLPKIDKRLLSDASLLVTSPEEIKRQIEEFNKQKESGIHIIV